MARLLLSWLSLVTLLACDAGPARSLAGSASPEPDQLAELPPARRPRETYLMLHSGERCVVEIQEQGTVVERLPTLYPCPLDLELGERIRLAGMNCMREGGAPAREIPVVCPDYLTNAERERRARQRSDAGVGP